MGNPRLPQFPMQRREIVYREPFSTRKTIAQISAEVGRLLDQHPTWEYVVDGDAQEFRVYKTS